MNVIRTYLAGMRKSVSPILYLRPQRLWEVDVMRGVAILMMVIYHFTWDLHGLGGYDIELYRGFWHYFQLATASLFIGIVGVSMVLRYHAMQARGGSRYLPFFQRGLEIFSWGLVIGIVTFLFDPTRYVRFGILHFIGFSIIITYPFLRFRWLNLFLGLFIILFGQIAALFAADNPWLGWLGLDLTIRPAFDYFPVIPWLGVVFLGIFLGNLLFPKGHPRWLLPSLGDWAPMRWLRLAGQNSLLIYLLHQPALITVLTLLGVVRL